MADLLVTEGLTKRYGGLLANDAVAMQLAAGEIRGLIGPNGAGKTTFVNIVTGIERPDSGTVKLGDVAISGLDANEIAERGLVRSFQVARVFGNLTVHENLMVPYFASARTRGTAEGVARAEERPARAPVGKVALGRPAHAAAGLRRIHDSRRPGACAG
jgi:branched-chain amino acid transport system ATP-binding protein